VTLNARYENAGINVENLVMWQRSDIGGGESLYFSELKF
jgi:hypothetical protein